MTTTPLGKTSKGRGKVQEAHLGGHSPPPGGSDEVMMSGFDSGYVWLAEPTGYSDRIHVGYERKKGIKDDCSESNLTNSFIFTWLAYHLLINNVCYKSWKSPTKHSHTQTIHSILRAFQFLSVLSPNGKHLFLGCLVKINLSSFLR